MQARQQRVAINLHRCVEHGDVARRCLRGIGLCFQCAASAFYGRIVTAQLRAQRQQLVDQCLFCNPTLFQRLQAAVLAFQQASTRSGTLLHHDADRTLALDDRLLGVQRFDASAAVVHFRRRGMQAHRHARAGRVQQAHRLVRQLPRRDVAVAELDRRFQRFVEDLHAVMLFHHRSDAAHHAHGLGLVRFVHLHGLEAPRQRGVLFDVFLVFGKRGRAHRAQRAARQCRLEQVRRIAGACGTTGADEGVGFVDEQNDRLGAGLHLVDHRAQTLFELALHAGAGLQQADIQRAQLHILQRRRHVAARDALREPFHHRGLADAGFADQDRVVLAAAHQDVDHLADLVVAADDRVQLAFARLGGEVGGEFLQRFLLAECGRRDGTAGLPGCSGLTKRKSIAGQQAIFRRAGHDLGEALVEHCGLELVELLGDRQQRMTQATHAQHTDHQIAGAYLRFTKTE